MNEEIAALRVRVRNHDERFERLEKAMKENLEKIYYKLDIYGNRPSWATSVVITVLSSGLIALLTVILSGVLK